MSRLVDELGLALLPVAAVCPIDYLDWQLVLSTDEQERADLRRRTDDSFAIHLWHEMWRRSGLDGSESVPGSLYADLVQRFGVTFG